MFLKWFQLKHRDVSTVIGHNATLAADVSLFPNDQFGLASSRYGRRRY
jgi:hypothetical protein